MRSRPSIPTSTPASACIRTTRTPTEPTRRALLTLRARGPRSSRSARRASTTFASTGDLEWQRARFRTHIRAAREAGKPLVIHTRAAADDTIAIMREERAGEAGGVMHCFTETWDVAQRRAGSRIPHLVLRHRHLQECGRAEGRRAPVPLDRMLIETDSPYLAPVPFRGKRNEPAYVPHVARGDRAAARHRRRRRRRRDIQQFLRTFRNRPPCALTD